MTRFTLLLGAALVCAAPAFGQGVGIGGQVGDPTGITLRIGGATALDLAAGWNLRNDSFFAQGHLVLGNRPIGQLPARSSLRFFYGPGLFVGVDNRNGRDDHVAFGVSFNTGLSYFAGPIEIFGQLTPRLQLVDETDFTLGGAIGLRYYP